MLYIYVKSVNVYARWLNYYGGDRSVALWTHLYHAMFKIYIYVFETASGSFPMHPSHCHIKI